MFFLLCCGRWYCRVYILRHASRPIGDFPRHRVYRQIVDRDVLVLFELLTILGDREKLMWPSLFSAPSMR